MRTSPAFEDPRYGLKKTAGDFKAFFFILLTLFGPAEGKDLLEVTMVTADK